MKKVIIGLGAVGVIIALRPAVGRISQKMHEHCGQMAGKCKQMMASQSGQQGAAGMREHCQEMTASHTGQGEKAKTPAHPEQKAAEFVGSERSD